MAYVSMRRPASPLIDEVRSRRAPPGRNELVRELVAHHEAAHAAHAYFSGAPIHSVQIFEQDRDGVAGEFRHHDRPGLDPDDPKERQEIGILVAITDAETAREWRRGVVGFAVSRPAQHRYGACHPLFDRMCEGDDRVVDYVIGILARSPEQQRQIRAVIEREAEEFVRDHWGAIQCLARALSAAGRLDKAEIEAIIGQFADGQDDVVHVGKRGVVRRTGRDFYAIDATGRRFGPFPRLDIAVRQCRYFLPLRPGGRTAACGGVA